MNHDGVRVLEPRGQVCFVPEPLDRDAVTALVMEQDFQRNDAVDRQLAGLVNGPHAALAELLDHLEAVVDDRTK